MSYKRSSQPYKGKWEIRHESGLANKIWSGPARFWFG